MVEKGKSEEEGRGDGTIRGSFGRRSSVRDWGFSGPKGESSLNVRYGTESTVFVSGTRVVFYGP